MEKINSIKAKYIALLAMFMAVALLSVACARNSGQATQVSPSNSPATQAADESEAEPHGSSADGAAGSNNNKPLVVATCADYPPFEFKLDEQLHGFDIQLAEYIAKQMGRELQLLELDFEDTMKAVESGEADLAIAALRATEPRKEYMAFSQPYFVPGRQCIITLAGNEGKFRQLSDLDGVYVSCTNGEIAHAQLDSVAPGAKLLRADSELAAMELLATGEAEAAAVSWIIGSVLCKTHPEQLAMADLDMGDAAMDPLCIALPKEDKELLKKVNDAISQAEKLELPARWMEKAVGQAAQLPDIGLYLFSGNDEQTVQELYKRIEE